MYTNWGNEIRYVAFREYFRVNFIRDGRIHCGTRTGGWCEVPPPSDGQLTGK